MSMSSVRTLLGLAAGALISISIGLAVASLMASSPLLSTSTSWVIFSSGGGSDGGFFKAGFFWYNNSISGTLSLELES